MPVCPTCGKKFSGFSFGAKPATQCRDCRNVSAAAERVAAQNAAAAGLPIPAIQRAPLPAVTLAIIALNALVYVAMGLSGVSWTEPSIRDAIRWGADFGPLTLSSQPWRLLTSTFVHFGFAHIFFNMWCLFNLGRSLEFLMGRRTFIATYFASGLAASLVSVAFDPWRVSAGASGAIFGVAGAFAFYMYVRKLPSIPGTIRQTRGSLAIFIVYNLATGAVHSGIDNSAHVGGLLAGFVLGALIPPIVKVRQEEFGAVPKVVTAAPLVDVASEEESGRGRLAVRVALGVFFVLAIALGVVHSQRAEVAEYGHAAWLIESGRTDEAIALLQHGTQLDPDALYSRIVLGQLFLDRGDAADAVPPLEEALKIDPGDEGIEHNLALAYVGVGRGAEAEAEIAKVFDAETEKWAPLFIRGLAEEESARSDEAVSDLSLVLQIYPDWPEAKYDLDRFKAMQTAKLPARSSSADPTPTQKGASARNAPPVGVAIPYRALVMKAKDWPLYP